MYDLSDTISWMSSMDQKDQFLAEYWQTKIRYDRLAMMLDEYKTRSLDVPLPCAPPILKRQLAAMGTYLESMRFRAAVEGILLDDDSENGFGTTL